MAARDEARARIVARMAEGARRGRPVAPEAAQAVTGASARMVPAGSLAEERAPRPAGAGDDKFWWPRAGVGVAATPRVDDGRLRLRLVLPRQVAATSGWRVAAIDCMQLAVAPQRTPG
jgi:hypothetical protein